MHPQVRSAGPQTSAENMEPASALEPETKNMEPAEFTEVGRQRLDGAADELRERGVQLPPS